jgi:hypothetical protein
MAIELRYDNEDALPEAFRNETIFAELFTRNDDGSISVTGVTGMKTQKDVDSVSEALRKERNDHKVTKDRLKPWGELNAEETLTQLDRIRELEAAAGGKLDDDAINKIVDGRLAQKTGPLDRQIKTISEERDALTQENAGLKNSIITRDRNDSVRAEATKVKSHATAVPDIEGAASVMLEQNEEGKWITKSGIEGITPGLGIDGWLRDMQKLRPHWWPESEGGGARGGNGGTGFNGANPWSAKSWNLTEQGKVFNDSADLAGRLAKAAGTSLGGPRPKG